MTNRWRDPSEVPGCGESVWLVIRDGDDDCYVDYGEVFDDYDGTILKRFSLDSYEHWPPEDVLKWMPCDIPKAAHD